MTGTRLYDIWINMKQRCSNPKTKSYAVYGGKGIQVCEEWKSSFTTFMQWARAQGYDDTLTIDRIDADKGYEPSNCRWITKAENSRRASETNIAFIQANGAKAKEYEYKGKSQSLYAWAEEIGISYTSMYRRIKNGWPPEEAFTTKRRGKR